MIDKTAFDIIGPYYTDSRPGIDFVPGRICEATALYLPPVLEFLRFDYDAANRGGKIEFTIGVLDDKTFDHTPVTGLRPLQRREAFVVTRAKRRPVVILSAPTQWPRIGVARQDFPEVYLVCPLHRFRDTHEREFRLRVEAWEYSMLFHMPSHATYEIRQGFLRLDRCQIVPKGQLRLKPVALTENALLGLQHYLSWFSTGRLDPDFANYRRLYLEALARTLEAL